MGKVFGIIPARSGSKGVADKNIRYLGGKPLLMWSLDSAINSRIDSILVTSDSDHYLSICDGLDVHRIKRPNFLATDDALTSDVIKHALEASNPSDEDIIVLLQPTCPFRRRVDIDEAIDKILENPGAGVISVADVGANHPLRMKRIVAGRLVNYLDTGIEDMRPRQELPPAYIRSGSIYACSVATFYKNNGFGGDPMFPIIQSGRYAVNIDTEEDFSNAQRICEQTD